MTAVLAPGQDAPTSEAASVGGVPAWHLIAYLGALAFLISTAGPIKDVDVFWHLRAGQFTLDGESFPEADPWAFTLPDVQWHTMSWLSELILGAVERAAGLPGIVGLRLVLAVAIAIALARLLIRGRSGWSGPIVYLVVLLPLTGFVQERPQTISFVFVIWLSGVTGRYLLDGRVPARLPFVFMTYVWALLHGLFVLAPGLLLLLALLTVVDQRSWRSHAARELAGTAAIALLVSAATPMGPRLLLAPLTVSEAARGFIGEWAPTNLVSPPTWGFALLLVLLVVCWCRSGGIPLAQVLYAVSIATFGMLAMRNVAVAALLLAPLAAAALAEAVRDASSIRVPRAPLGLLALTASLVVPLQYMTFEALPDSAPTKIADSLAQQSRPIHVLNDYDSSGFLIYEAGQDVRLSVDGRAERYGSSFLSDYALMMKGSAGWRAAVEALDVDAAVLASRGPLDDLLVAEAGWTRRLQDGDLTLLTPPGATWR